MRSSLSRAEAMALRREVKWPWVVDVHKYAPNALVADSLDKETFRPRTFASIVTNTADLLMPPPIAMVVAFPPDKVSVCSRLALIVYAPASSDARIK